MKIRSARFDDLDFFARCVTLEGWMSETRPVFESFFAHDPDGCLVAENETGPIGMCVATAYDTCGFLGELIVLPEQRGRGLGTRLMKHATAYLHERGCESIYLDGDLPAVPIYERLGFRAVTRSLRFVGRIEAERREEVAPLTPDLLPALLAFDRAAFGADRSFFLRRRFQEFPDLCLVARSRGHLDGYIMAQPGHGVVTVGPWLVDDPAVEPLRLLRALAGVTGQQKLRVGVLESNRAAAGLMRSLDGIQETEPSLRMVLGPDRGLGASARLVAIGAPSKG